jgi:hypothetical protein
MNNHSLKADSSFEPPHMSVQDFIDWGLSEVAYVKPVDMDGRTVYAVFAANGQQLGLMENRTTALAALFQNDLEPISLH